MMKRYLPRGLKARPVVIALLLATAAAGAAAALSRREAPVKTAPARKTASPWGAAYFPDVPLVTHAGESVRFFSDLLAGKIVVVSFVFTHCPDVCPLETAKLRQVQELLGDRVGRDIFMYSISIDPERDTVPVLAAYAERYRVGPGWTFLRGSKADVTLLRKKLGMLGDEPGSGELKNHSVNVMIGNQRTGTWIKVSPYENPHVIAEKIGSWLDNWRQPSKKRNSYADAPEVRNFSDGEGLYRSRCAACHTLGGERLGGSPAAAVGPDLLGVTGRRDRAWLARWIKEPDKMIAERDPLALALVEQYGNVVMANTHLSSGDVETVLSYLEEESRRVAKTASKPVAADDRGVLR
ncbi:MAG: SCO family protein [Anaeromyxobacteraceae bacterium]